MRIEPRIDSHDRHVLVALDQDQAIGSARQYDEDSWVVSVSGFPATRVYDTVDGARKVLEALAVRTTLVPITVAGVAR